MTLKELTVVINELKTCISGNGSKGLKAEVEVLKNSLKYYWLILSVIISLNAAILVLLLRK